MHENYQSIVASLVMAEKRMAAEVVELRAKGDAAYREHTEKGKTVRREFYAKSDDVAKGLAKVRRAKADFGAPQERRTVKKSDFVAACRVVLAERGPLPIDQLIEFAKSSLKTAAYSLSGVDMHAKSYLKSDACFGTDSQGLINLTSSTPPSEVA
jgi:hypothetical protein